MHYSHNHVKSQKVQPINDDFQLKITSKSFKVFQPLKRLITEKSRNIPSLQSVHVTFLSNPNQNKIEVDVSSVVNDQTFRAKASHQDAYSAIILAFRKLRSIANKSLTKQTDKKRKKAGLSANEQLLTQEDGYAPFSEHLGFIHSNYIPKDHDVIALHNKQSKYGLLQSTSPRQVTFKPKRT